MNITRKQSTALKGIAIITVLMGHGFSNLSNNPYFIINFLGAVGVGIFLILSGYGLTESYQKSGIKPVAFIKKRLLVVMVPYWLVMLLQTVADKLFLHRKMDLRSWFISFVGYVDYDHNDCIDKTMWYITYLIVWYILFFVLFSIKMPAVIRIIILFAVSLFIRINCFGPVADWIINCFSFPLGVLLSYAKPYINKKTVPYILWISLFLFFYISSGYFESKIAQETMWNIYALSGSLICICIIVLNENLSNNGFLILMGEASYAIYLIEGYIYQKVSFLYSVDTNFIDVFVFGIISTGIGLVIHFWYNRIKGLSGKDGSNRGE